MNLLTLAEGPVGGLWIATVSTTHFDFMAAGRSDEDARDALMRGWEEHCRQAEEDGRYVDRSHVGRDDVNVDHVWAGACLRDHDVISQ